LPTDVFRSPDKPHIHHRARIAAAAVAYHKLAREIGEEIAYIFHIRGRCNDAYANLIYDYFPAAPRWTEVTRPAMPPASAPSRGAEDPPRRVGEGIASSSKKTPCWFSPTPNISGSGCLTSPTPG